MDLLWDTSTVAWWVEQMADPRAVMSGNLRAERRATRLAGLLVETKAVMRAEEKVGLLDNYLVA